MQYTNEKFIRLNNALAEVVRAMRVSRTGMSVNKFGDSYGIEKIIFFV